MDWVGRECMVNGSAVDDTVGRSLNTSRQINLMTDRATRFKRCPVVVVVVRVRGLLYIVTRLDWTGLATDRRLYVQ